ncbi:MAG TPA: peptidylprolyl isomerase [Saprospiraceae bacterium]|nr:peptidylprolyl isomerase [Saprospiraceae bacterium]HPN67962.1 peptidylprolyl isomerase [Saprospiraceae bacterium]
MNLRNIVAMVLAFMAVGLFAQKPILVDKVVARVGSENILLSEIEEEFSYAKKSDPTVDVNVKCEILDNIISQKVIIYQAKLDSVEVTDEQVNLELDTRFDRILMQMNGDEEFFKEYYNATVAQMKERYRDDQKQQILAQMMQRNLINEVEITPREVLEFYNSIPKDSLPFLNAEVEMAELIIKPVVNKESRAESLTLAEDLLKRIKEGKEDFAELATKYSNDVESAKRGGDLGFARRGSFVPEFESAAFSMKKDEISDIIETDFGFHILKLDERRGNLVHVRHILITPKITEDDENLARLKLDSIRNMIAADSITFTEAVKRYGDKASLSFNNGGKLRNPNTGNSFFETKDLDYDTYFAIEDLTVNATTKVMEMKDQRGQKMFRIIQLQSKSKPHKVSIETDYDKIAVYAKESKKAKYFGDWMVEHRKSVFIKIDPMMEGCENLAAYLK